MKPIILAHRAYRDGTDPGRENSCAAVAECFEQGWGVEIDIRRSGGRFYLSHDIGTVALANDALSFCHLVREMRPPAVAINIKELGYERELLAFLEQEQIIDHVFLFDMELLEDIPGKTARLLSTFHPRIRIAARSSDRHEPLERALACPFSTMIWADEFERFWLTGEDVRRAKESGKFVYVISPEIHGYDMRARNRRWEDFTLWGVDGICTDYPADLSRFIAGHS